jgi:hypothetical protein
MRLLSDQAVGVQWVQYKPSQSINDRDNTIPASPCTYTSSSTALIQHHKAQIKSKYKLTDLGPINWVLDIRTRKTESFCSCNWHPFLHNLISQTLNHFQLPWIQIFTIPSPNAQRHLNKPLRCAESLTMQPLDWYYPLPLPHAPMLLSQQVFSHNYGEPRLCSLRGC